MTLIKDECAGELADRIVELLEDVFPDATPEQMRRANAAVWDALSDLELIRS